MTRNYMFAFRNGRTSQARCPGVAVDWEAGAAGGELAAAGEAMALDEAQLEAGPPARSASTQKPALVPLPLPMPGPAQATALLLWLLISAPLCLQSSPVNAKHICQSSSMWPALEMQS